MKAFVFGLLLASSALASAPSGAPKFPRPFWFFETTYADGRIVTYPVQMDEYTVALPYNGRVLHAEVPSMIPAKHSVGKDIKRRFTASRGNDVLSGEAVCDLSKYTKEGTEAGQAVLNFSGGVPASTPTKIRLFCQF